MNRIYQGKVTAVEIPDGIDEQRKPKWKKLDAGESALWQHHELFQDAVNYYTLALAAMAAGVEGDSEQAHALRGWAAKVKETWANANRKAETFAGPQARLAPILKLDRDKSDFETASSRVLHSSRATPAQRSAALMQLLSAKGDLNVICGERLPWLASAHGKCGATSKAASSSQEAKRQRAIRPFHQCSEKEALAQAATLDLDLFLTQPPKDFVEGADAAKILRDYFTKASKKFPELKATASIFEKFITSQADTLKVPSLGRRPSGLYPLAAVFRFFPTPETLTAFREATKCKLRQGFRRVKEP